MSVIERVSNNTRTKSNTRVADEYEGIYLNPGVFVQDEEGEKKFLRFNRGIALSDLITKKIYTSMSEDFAADTTILNERIEAMRERALKLGEGEHVVLNIPIVLYRRQEAEESAPTPKSAKKDIAAELFGEE
jgi:hypothetical protein